MFKVGLLVSKGGTLQWKQMKDDERPVDALSTFTNSNMMVYSVHQRELSI